MPGPEPSIATIEWRTSGAPVPYDVAVAAMEARVEAIRAGAAPELVWLLEHPPLYTAGTGTEPSDLIDPDFLPVFQTGRGGKLTYHGPGQRIAYVMLDLERRGGDLRAYIRNLEAWIVHALACFGLKGERREGRVGIWVAHADGSEAKIAAIGVRVRHWVSYHGISVNLDPDLSHYRGIVPCGVREHGVTSIKAEGVVADLAALDRALKSTFGEVFAARAGA